MSEFRREIRFTPGYDFIDGPTPRPGYGRHGMSIRFLLHGTDGTTQFVMNTGWLPTHTKGDPNEPAWRGGLRVDVERRLTRPDGTTAVMLPEPYAVDLGYHWRAPLYDGMYQPDSCDVIDGTCFYDGSGLNAEPIMAKFFQEGDAAVWAELERYYRDVRADAAEYAAGGVS